MNEENKERRIIVVDSQRIDAMQKCSYYYDLRFNRNLVPVDVADYLERGSLIHIMMSQYYKLKNYRHRWPQNRKNHADIVESCVNVGRFFANKMALEVPEVLYTIQIFKQYTSYWENDDWNNILGIEQVGSKIMYQDKDLVILYEVKIDMILSIAGKIIPVDHKSSQSRRDPNQLSNQFKGYCWFLGVNNFIVNEIGFQKTIEPKDKFRRHVLSFSESIIEEWKCNTVNWIKMQNHFNDNAFFPRNYTSCDKYSGCDYVNVCRADPGDFREFKLKRDFTERLWDVGKAHL